MWYPLVQSNQILIDLTPCSNDSRRIKYLAELKKAIADRRIVILKYSNNEINATMREVEPYRLLLKGNRWYLQGFCLSRNEMRTFKLYRIAQLIQTTSIFTPREIDFIALDKGLAANKATVDVTIRFPENAKKEIIGHWGDNIITSFEDGYYTAEIQLDDNEHG